MSAPGRPARDAGPQPIPLAVASLLSDPAHLRGALPRASRSQKRGFLRNIAMNFRPRVFGVMQAFAVVLSLALPLVVVTATSVDARVGGGVSSGSRGGRTFSAPPSTSTAPNTAQPFNRTITQPGSPGLGTGGGGFFNRPGMGLFGGLAAGFLGAGLLGMLFGG